MNFTRPSVANTCVSQTQHRRLSLLRRHLLRKIRQPVSDCAAGLDATRADSNPKVFTQIHVHFTVTGKGLDPKRVEQAVKLSAEKYCSASIMLGKTAEITHDFEVVEG